ncbi:MAG TPA: thiopurine S-methyltransferase [Chiayiivirga sp.]|nr:thiopurine S-methyltransferase [Chiayiivirga sp.]
MNPEFWRQRWREGRIGFHRTEVMPLLERHWPSLGVAPGCRVLVPLCGKSLDMAWLAARGHQVLGVDVSELAIEQFLSEHHLEAQVHRSAMGTHYRAGAIELICGDAFALDASTLSSCTALYDRAAMIALPPDLRHRYVESVYSRLPQGDCALLITLEYPQPEKDGPPFSVDEPEVRARLTPAWTVEVLERRDILAHEPGFGVSSLQTVVYRLTRRGVDATAN